MIYVPNEAVKHAAEAHAGTVSTLSAARKNEYIAREALREAYRVDVFEQLRGFGIFPNKTLLEYDLVRGFKDVRRTFRSVISGVVLSYDFPRLELAGVNKDGSLSATRPRLVLISEFFEDISAGGRYRKIGEIPE